MTETGEFTGLGAVYGELDLQGDVIERGAFRKSINEQSDGYPLLWSHRQDTPVGLAKLEDDSKGLRVHGRIDRQDPDGEIAYQRVQKKLVKGLSIGYTVPNASAVKYAADGTRYLSEVRLHEMSLVVVPAQPGAQILTVKQLGDATRLLKQFAGTQEAEELAELKRIEAEVKRLLANTEPNGIVAELKRLAAEIAPARY